jgi:transposase
MTHRELQILAARERVTLRQRRRGTRRYWDICARHHGELTTRYLCTDSALATLSEEEFLRRVRSLPRRWVVERTFAWLGRNRRLSKDYEHETTSSEAVVYIASIRLLVRRLAKTM